jgi:membrane protein YdbS with pleckstrin-like domain
VVGHHTATIPRNRVQTLTSENGPIDRLLGLTSVTVHTAGAGAPNLSIPHLEDATVEWLRGELARGRHR